MPKFHLAPDIAQSIRSGVPLAHLSPEFAASIRDRRANDFLAPDVAEDINDLAGGPGGDQPEWVPVNAKIFIDLVNDRAWTEADGEVAIDTLLGSDPNTVNAWAVTSYDAGNLTADGYAGSGNRNIALIGSALSMTLAGTTIVGKFKKLTTGTNGSSLAIVSADGNNAVEVDLDGTHLGAASWAGPASVTSSVPQNQGIAGAINCFAVTYMSTRLEAAANGGSVVSASLTAPEVSGLIAALYAVGQDDALQSITIYDPLPSTAGLSALSETGVTNTAPHDVIITPLDDDVVVAGTTVTAPYSTFIRVGQVFASDDEGNPLTFSIVGDPTFDGGGNWYIHDGNYVGFEIIEPNIGDHNLTLRATDPGGLYVEQAFTITVTA